MEKEKELQTILQYEAKEAAWGAKASRLRQKYAEKYSSFKKGDKVIVRLYDDSKRYGIIRMVKFDTHKGFVYQIEPRGKDWSDKTNRKAFYYYNTIPQRSYNKVKNIEKP